MPPVLPERFAPVSEVDSVTRGTSRLRAAPDTPLEAIHRRVSASVNAQRCHVLSRRSANLVNLFLSGDFYLLVKNLMMNQNHCLQSSLSRKAQLLRLV